MDFEFNEQQEALKAKVRKLAEEKLAPLAPEVDETNVISWEVVRLLTGERLFRLVAPEEYGGDGIKSVNMCIVREELSRVCSQADVTFAMQALGTYSITHAGTDQQKRKYLPPVAAGEQIATIALTESGGGSDIANIKTTATKDGDYYLLNGEKTFISQAPEANIYTVFASTDPSLKGRGLSAFVVEKGTPGFEPGKRLELLSPHVIGEIKFNNCRVHQENMIGQPGEGIKIALTTLDMLRPSVGAAALGLAEAAFEEALKYTTHRQAFGQTVADFQYTQFKLADMATEIDAARFLIYRAAAIKDKGKKETIKEASMAKLYATEVAQRVADLSLQMHGGVGLIKGVTIERIYREVRAPRIYEGTSEIQKLTIARQLLKEYQA